MVKLNKTNLFASMMLASALFLSCSRADNPVDSINDDPVPEQPGDDQPGDDQPGDDQPADDTAYLKCPDAKHPHIIDLGLPSGTKWACCNVGAKAPEEYGGYYAWGETSEKSYYDWDTYKYYNGATNECIIIGNDIAGTSYDAATANWGGPWRMPSVTQIEELLKNTTSEWTTENGVAGRRFIGTNGGSVFLPAASDRVLDQPSYTGMDGGYWSSMLFGRDPYGAYKLYFDLSSALWDSMGYRFSGQLVRPVRQ